MKKVIFSLILVVLLASCQKEVPNNLPGYYDIISMESEIALDLDGDGIAQKDLYDELSQTDEPYSRSYSTVSPKKGQEASAKSIFFLGIPKQRFDESTMTHYYGSGSMICHYDFLTDGSFVMINDRYEYNSERQGDIISLEWDGKDLLTGVFRLRYYIIEEQRWVSPLVTIVFQRVIVKGGDF